VTQLLAPVTMEKGKTLYFAILIEKIELPTFNFPDTLWVSTPRCCRKDDGDAKGILGKVQVFDQSGQTVPGAIRGRLHPSGPRRRCRGRKAAANLVIASNFTQSRWRIP